MRANILPLAATVLLAAAGAAAGAETSWRDIESRIQYGYYTEDAAALRTLRGLIAADESHDRLHGYYAALLAWREAQLAAQGVPGSRAAPGDLAQRCVTEADNVLEAQAAFADALALRAACLATPLRAGGGSLSEHRARKDIEHALATLPHDPRVLLVDAMNDYQLAARGGRKDGALTKLRLAVAAFEAERAGLERLPGWGAAEAYLYLARDLLDHADPVGARDALEHALLIAPEFAQARRLMARIVGG
ncbi:MAG TPA: hypothetical protein VGR86_05395 [Steroidobacteraceae bacterium]|nr:hypothetical protein [Steroidobacteraceae bacterium]